MGCSASAVRADGSTLGIPDKWEARIHPWEAKVFQEAGIETLMVTGSVEEYNLVRELIKFRQWHENLQSCMLMITRLRSEFGGHHVDQNLTDPMTMLSRQEQAMSFRQTKLLEAVELYTSICEDSRRWDAQLEKTAAKYGVRLLKLHSHTERFFDNEMGASPLAVQRRKELYLNLQAESKLRLDSVHKLQQANEGKNMDNPTMGTSQLIDNILSCVSRAFHEQLQQQIVHLEQQTDGHDGISSQIQELKASAGKLEARHDALLQEQVALQEQMAKCLGMFDAKIDRLLAIAKERAAEKNKAAMRTSARRAAAAKESLQKLGIHRERRLAVLEENVTQAREAVVAAKKGIWQVSGNSTIDDTCKRLHAAFVAGSFDELVPYSTWRVGTQEEYFLPQRFQCTFTEPCDPKESHLNVEFHLEVLMNAESKLDSRRCFVEEQLSKEEDEISRLSRQIGQDAGEHDWHTEEEYYCTLTEKDTEQNRFAAKEREILVEVKTVQTQIDGLHHQQTALRRSLDSLRKSIEHETLKIPKLDELLEEFKKHLLMVKGLFFQGFDVVFHELISIRAALLEIIASTDEEYPANLLSLRKQVQQLHHLVADAGTGAHILKNLGRATMVNLIAPDALGRTPAALGRESISRALGDNTSTR